jgi:hypothetical protein
MDDRVPSAVDAVRLYFQKRIDRCNRRIALARKAAGARPRRRERRGQPATAADVAERRAYRDALKALNTISSDGGTPAALRLAAEEVARVKSALARIYGVTQHASHDIAAAGDWAIVEGEAQAALNIVHEAERNR